MAKGPCKCKKDHECEECPEWIFTFADLVMLMMGFFVILWVLKPAPGKSPTDSPDEDWIKVAAAIREAFGYLPDPQSKDPIDIHMLLKKLEQMKPLKGPGDGGKTKLERKGAEGTDPEVTDVRAGKESVIGGKLLFAAGEGKLDGETIKSLDQVAEQVRGHYNIVLVKGHTSLDDLAESSTPHQRMDLSIRRAQVVADYLTNKGVAPEILRVQGCSTFEPVAQREYTPGAQAMNRRVEIKVTADLVEERRGSAKAGTKGASAAAALPAASPVSAKAEVSAESSY